MADQDDYMYEQYDDDFEQDEDVEAECGLMPDGQCMLAGTEHCDWDCGALNEQRIADMKEAKETDRG